MLHHSKKVVVVVIFTILISFWIAARVQQGHIANLVGDDLTLVALAPSAAAFKSAPKETVIQISAAEYYGLRHLPHTTIIGAYDAWMRGPKTVGVLAQEGITTLDTKVPSSSKIVGFSIVVNNPTTVGIWYASDYTSGRAYLINYTPPITKPGIHYFVVKTPRHLAGDRYLAISNSAADGIAATHAGSFVGAHAFLPVTQPPPKDATVTQSHETITYPLIQLLNRLQ